MSRAVSPTPMDIMGSGSAGLEPFPMLPTSLPVTPLTFITIAEANLTTEFVGRSCFLILHQILHTLFESKPVYWVQVMAYVIVIC